MPSKPKIVKNRFAHKAAHFLGGIVYDTLCLQRNLFTVTSAKILTGITPFYLSARLIDEDIACTFHNRVEHKNINQLPNQCHQVAQKGVAVPMVFLSGLAFYGWSADLRMTGRIFAIGLPFVHSGKDIIKQLRTKSCLRPWHEHFSRDERSSGGFPSGHMANVVYMASLFGMRHGLKWGAPLGLFAAFVFADFINCNRHYLSQMFAGAGLGLLYAFAADRLIEDRLNERMQCVMVSTQNGSPAVRIGCTF